MRMTLERRGQYYARVEVEDYLTPVLYCRTDAGGFHAGLAPMPPTTAMEDLDSQTAQDVYDSQLGLAAARDMIGRDGDLLDLETRLESKGAVNILGKRGCGKTAFVKYAESWWKKSFYAEECRWFDFWDPNIWDVVQQWLDEQEPQAQDLDNTDIGPSNCRLHNFSRIAIVDDAEPRLWEDVNFVERFTRLLNSFPNNAGTSMLESQGIKLGEASPDVTGLSTLLQLHDNNPLFMKLYLPFLSYFDSSPSLFSEFLRLNTPLTLLGKSITGTDLVPPQHGSSGTMHVIRKLLDEFFEDDLLAYWVLLSLAPFTNAIPFNIGKYLLYLLMSGILDTGLSAAGIAQNSSGKYITNPAESYLKITVAYNRVLYVRNEGQADKICQDLLSIFARFYEERVGGFLSGPTSGPHLMATAIRADRQNIYNAMLACTRHKYSESSISPSLPLSCHVSSLSLFLVKTSRRSIYMGNY
ncbi:hypothetical protein BKA65DRAFT_580880 [Rhexocercosporidium sp. MPI-PUGE-AT-0058]|nr:hypothetical protein BKA65DRAFT_580880 [Rhexocercosporidium sp. MPI-PUGE-AT-0058]